MDSMNTSSVDVVSNTATNEMSKPDVEDYCVELAILEKLEDPKEAVKLFKNLLARNKELETSLKSHQAKIDEQAQQIKELQANGFSPEYDSCETQIAIQRNNERGRQIRELLALLKKDLKSLYEEPTMEYKPKARDPL